MLGIAEDPRIENAVGPEEVHDRLRDLQLALDECPTSPVRLPFATAGSSASSSIDRKTRCCIPIPPAASAEAAEVNGVVSTLVTQYREKERLLANHLSPVDQRIQTFLFDYLQDVPVAKLPARTFIWICTGMARALSLPVDRRPFQFRNHQLLSRRQGVLHNPRSDRRTTQGFFTSPKAACRFPPTRSRCRKAFRRLLGARCVPTDVLACLSPPRRQSRRMLHLAAAAPDCLPGRPDPSPEKTMETGFFAPGSLVSNLDFVESIFRQRRRSNLPENDAALDAEHWTGHTGCVILAPHLTRLTRRTAGLPHWEEATERQRRDGMCWKDE